jgi:hypothetical protein
VREWPLPGADVPKARAVSYDANNPDDDPPRPWPWFTTAAVIVVLLALALFLAGHGEWSDLTPWELH